MKQIFFDARLGAQLNGKQIATINEATTITGVKDLLHHYLGNITTEGVINVEESGNFITVTLANADFYPIIDKLDACIFTRPVDVVYKRIFDAMGVAKLVEFLTNNPNDDANENVFKNVMKAHINDCERIDLIRANFNFGQEKSSDAWAINNLLTNMAKDKYAMHFFKMKY